MMRIIHLYLDDIRNPPDDSWTLVRTAEEAKTLLGDPGVTVEYCSLDHDLGECVDCENAFPSRGYPLVSGTCRHRMTGYDLVKWMAQEGIWPCRKPMVHSANPVGRANMIAVIERHYITKEEKHGNQD